MVETFQLNRSMRFVGDLAAAEPEKRSRWVIATDAFVPQDGWSLRADGMELHGDQLPILWNHGFSVGHSMPVGRWNNLERVGGEVHGTPEWAPSVVPGVDAVKALAEANMVRTSVSFEVLEYRAMTAEERKALGVPERVAIEPRVATRWRARETSYVAIPADPTAGAREIMRTIGEQQYRELGFQDRIDYEKIRSIIAEEMVSVHKLVERAVREALTGTATASAPAAPTTGTQQGDAQGRKALYSPQILGLDRLLSVAERLKLAAASGGASPHAGNGTERNAGTA